MRTMSAVAMMLALAACGETKEPKEPSTERERVESQQNTARGKESPARAQSAEGTMTGGSWFCRTVVFHRHKDHESKRLGFCHVALADCDKSPEGPGAYLHTWDPGDGETTRVVTPCEEYPIAYCFRTRILECFTDIVICNREREHGTSDVKPSPCFPSKRPL